MSNDFEAQSRLERLERLERVSGLRKEYKLHVLYQWIREGQISLKCFKYILKRLDY